MPKQRVFDNGVLVEEIDLPDRIIPPRALSKTEFMDTVIAGLVTTGLTQGAAEARFQEIIEAAATYPGNTELARRVRYAEGRYWQASRFDKNIVAGMLTLLVAGNVAGITAAERTAILAAWPNE
jgi:hypothetical protein